MHAEYNRKKWVFLFTVAQWLGFAGLVGFILVLMQAYAFDIQMLILSQARRAAFVDAISTGFGDFMTLTLSILVEALPFVVLGVLFSVLIQVFLPTDKVIRRLPKNIVIRRAIISCLGILMPVCECGNVPVARGLLARGFSTGEAVIFLLAAPSVNIITFIVTMEAFKQTPEMAVWRVLITILVANIVAVLVTKLIAKHRLLTPEFTAYCETSQHEPHTLTRATTLFRSEMWLITRLLVIGAMVAAASQVLIPREVITAIGSDLVLSVLAMLILAFVVSICSSVDAFFALAYANIFGLGPILAFLVAGPMVDIKMIALLKSTFTYRTIAVITLSVFMLAFVAGVVFSYV